MLVNALGRIRFKYTRLGGRRRVMEPLFSFDTDRTPRTRLHPFGGHAMMDVLSGTAQGSGDSAPRGGTILSAGFLG